MTRKQFELKAPKAVERSADGSDFRVFTSVGKDDEPAELMIFDQIGEDWYGEGITATSVVDFCRECKGREINVRINSFGGSVYEGFVIYNSLVSHDAPVTTIVEGIAYSAASVIAMAGDVVKMHKSSDFGIHRASIGAWGNQHDLAATRDWLITIDEHVVEIYQDKSNATTKQVEEWLDGVSDGTLFSAAKALAVGFCDEIIDPKDKGERTAKDMKDKAANQFKNRTAARNRLAIQRLRG